MAWSLLNAWVMSLSCPKCKAEFDLIRKDGFYFRKSDSKLVPRFKCRSCGKRFSRATFSPNYHQNKRRVNSLIRKLLCSVVSHRRIAIIVGIDRKTVARKRKYLAAQAAINQRLRFQDTIAPYVQFDDLETIEHTKLKPVTVTMLVNSERKVLGFGVARIKAKGHLAKLSRAKYGRRANEAPFMRNKLFEQMTAYVHPQALFESDEHPSYPDLIKKHFPKAEHQTFKSARSSVTGQGELKRIKFDPLFKINHTFAMFRANVSRLIRLTWNTTKDLEALNEHLMIYADFHNEQLT